MATLDPAALRDPALRAHRARRFCEGDRLDADDARSLLPDPRTF